MKRRKYQGRFRAAALLFILVLASQTTLPAAASTAFPRPAGPTNLRVVPFVENGSHYFGLIWYDSSNNEKGFYIETSEKGNQDAGVHTGTGWTRFDWLSWENPHTRKCFHVNAFNYDRGDYDGNRQYSAWTPTKGWVCATGR
jgi:hypothetical protein